MRQDEILKIYELMGIGSDAEREKFIDKLNWFFQKEPKEYYFIRFNPNTEIETNTKNAI
jgi:hypothetical protein